MFDFRSDTVTKPTPAMISAMMDADVGDSARGDDPTHNRLIERACELSGKDAALFLPSGTMSNLSAILAHTRPGDEVIVEERAHIYNSEVGGLSAVAGAVPRLVRGDAGVMQPDAVKRALSPGAAHRAPTGLICIENTLNAAGGKIFPIDTALLIKDIAKEAGIPVHLDGARIFNAAAALGVDVATLCRPADSVMFALSKGLGAPMGSILAGDDAFIERAARKARMLGGGMRQTGYMAAAALVALEDPCSQLRRDHDMADALAQGLAAIEGLQLPDPVETNIVNCYVDRFAEDAAGFVACLGRAGVLANFAGTKVRFVTHAEIDDAAIKACVAAAATAMKELGRAA
jgi:threonine aldolase